MESKLMIILLMIAKIKNQIMEQDQKTNNKKIMNLNLKLLSQITMEKSSHRWLHQNLKKLMLKTNKT